MTDAPVSLGQTLRIGVTGTRKLDESQLYFLRPRVVELLGTVVVLSTGANGQRPRLQLLSPLAEGADRLVAECALAQGFELVCPLPFPQAVYEEDFSPVGGSLAEFRRLLALAGTNVLALDGARDDAKQGLYAEARSYEAVGRLIVRNCDLIIGIWNGLPGEGRGGTADTIHYAASFGPPVIWMHANDGRVEPRWIEDAHDLRHNAPPRTVPEPLALYLKRLLHPSTTRQQGGDDGLLHFCGHCLSQVADGFSGLLGRPKSVSGLAAFLNEKPKPARGIWRFHGRLMRFMAGGKEAPWTPPHIPENLNARRWFEHYQPADDRAGECAHRYRSSYVWVFVLGALALIAAAFSLWFGENLPGKFIATAVEFIVLALIAGLVIFDGKLGWHRRSIEYRLLAELCRKQQALAPLAWVVPRASAWATTAPEAEAEPDAPHAEPTSWVNWLFSAWLRDAGLPTGTIDPLWVEHARDFAQRDLLNDQIDYHTARRAQTFRAGKRLVLFGEIAFLAVLAVVIWKMLLIAGHLGAPETTPYATLEILGLAAAILPAVSAMLVGIRAYAELEMLAEQSDAMLKAMRHAKKQIDELDPKQPLASQALGSALAGVTTMMLEDLEGWARLFRGKILDA